MTKVLYRIYRPSTFDDVIGQDHITLLLKNSILKNKLSHAYLFSGPRGLGKTSVARILAKTVNCKNIGPSGNPCNKCENCLAVNKGTFLDLIEIDAASNRGIDQIRELREKVSYQPTAGKFKVYIIDEVHMLTTEAFNALLKTLEEPPEFVIFILATTEVYKIPLTVVSRCQKYDFRLAKPDQLKQLYERVLGEEKIVINNDALDVLIKYAKGSFRDALSLMQVVLNASVDDREISLNDVNNILGLPDNTMVYYFLENMVNRNLKKSISMLREVYEKGVSINHFVYNIIEVLKDSLIAKTLKSDCDFHFFNDVSDSEILRMLKLFIQVEKEIKGSVNPILPLEVVLVDYFYNDNGILSQNIVDKHIKNDNIRKQSKEEGLGNIIERKKENSTEKSVRKVKKELSDLMDKDITTNVELCDIEISSEELEKKWDDLIEKIKVYNGHLFAFLNHARLLGFKDGVLKLEVDYSFHKDRIVSPNSKQILQVCFKEVYGITPKIWCRVSKNVKQELSLDYVPEIKNLNQENKLSDKINNESQSVNKDQKGSLSKEIEDVFKDLI